MLCEKRGEKWVRNENEETLIQLAVTATMLETDNARMLAEPDYKGMFYRKLNSRGNNAGDLAFQMAADILFTSPDSLATYFHKP
jgi:hypothetical protein